MPLVHQYRPFQRKHVNVLQCAEAHTHWGAPAIHHTSNSYIICIALPFSPFLVHIHLLLMTRTKDSWEGDGVSCDLTIDPFMMSASPWSPRNCSLICHPRFVDNRKKKYENIKIPQNSSVKAWTNWIVYPLLHKRDFCSSHKPKIPTILVFFQTD